MNLDVKINGSGGYSGSIVIGPNQKVEVQFPWGFTELVFNPSAPKREVTLLSSEKKLVFDDMDNPIGSAATLKIPYDNGDSHTLSLVVYVIGQGSDAYRILYYTVA